MSPAAPPAHRPTGTPAAHPGPPARSRRARTWVAGALTAATALGTVALSQGPTLGAGASYRATYTCTSSLGGEAFALPMDVTVSARRSGGVTTLEVPGGNPVLSDEDTYEDVRLTTTLDATADGSPVQLKADRVVTIRPGEPVDLPALVGTTTGSTGSTVQFVPGRFVLVVRMSIITATQTCTLDGPAPVVTVPVAGAVAPSPTATPTSPPTVTPTASPTPTAVPPLLHMPRVTAKLDRKVQRVRGKRATVVVTLKPSRAGAAPAGTVKVTVGKRLVRTVTVSPKAARRAGAKGRTLKVRLPANLRPGRHTVKVRVAWKERELFGTQQRRLTLRVRR